MQESLNTNVDPDDAALDDVLTDEQDAMLPLGCPGCDSDGRTDGCLLAAGEGAV